MTRDEIFQRAEKALIEAERTAGDRRGSTLLAISDAWLRMAENPLEIKMLNIESLSDEDLDILMDRLAKRARTRLAIAQDRIRQADREVGTAESVLRQARFAYDNLKEELKGYYSYYD